MGTGWVPHKGGVMGKKRQISYFITLCALLFLLYTTSQPQLPPNLNHQNKIYERVPATTTYQEKPWTMILYGSARNDLLSFVYRNIEQLQQVGSNDNINLLVHLDSFGPGRKKLTQRFIVLKGKLLQVGEDMYMDSGDPATLIDACTWAFTNFPSRHTMVILWNHGTGDLEPYHGRAINSTELFVYNPETKKIELNRSINFLDYLNESQTKTMLRGICFDEVTSHYLTNRQVGKALETVCNKCLNGQPIDIICCDACLMQGIGFAYSLKPYCGKPVGRYLVGSQEVVLATGYSYANMFSKLAKHPTTPEEFTRHIVHTFANTYQRITNDYTQSVINLEAIDPLYEHVDTLAHILVEGLQNQNNNSVFKFIQKSSSRSACTYFEEPSYKDIDHLLTNMAENIGMISLVNAANTQQFKTALLNEIDIIRSIIDQIVTENIAGSNLKDACGISIYLPENKIHPSYARTDFAQNNGWFKMISLYIKIKELAKEPSGKESATW
jgi:hypothetical protein